MNSPQHYSDRVPRKNMKLKSIYCILGLCILMRLYSVTDYECMIFKTFLFAGYTSLWIVLFNTLCVNIIMNKTATFFTTCHSKIPLGFNRNMGVKFGNITKVRGIIYYSLSPFEQKAFAGAISKGIPNIFRRFSDHALKIIPAGVLCYLIIDYGEKKNLELARKNPADYANDE